MNTLRNRLILFTLWGLGMSCTVVFGQDRQVIKAIYIPLADHYAAIVAYEKYGHMMEHADFHIERMKNWKLLRAYFMSGDADMAFVMSPLAMDMFSENPIFRWVSLMHRDGNALAINDILGNHLQLPENRADRKPDGRVAGAFARAKKDLGHPVECAVPHLLATHTVVLYKYLAEHGMTLGLDTGSDKDVIAVEVSPAKSPVFIKKNNARGIPASFEQSLPWADVVETGGFGRIAWYSKDVMPWPDGHVECIAIATDRCIAKKREALQEVIHYIHLAGLDIESARKRGGSAMESISDMVRKHIPEHNHEAIVQSLRLDLNVINYKNLNIDPAGLKKIMDLAVQGGILRRPIDLGAFADPTFSVKLPE